VLVSLVDLASFFREHKQTFIENWKPSYKLRQTLSSGISNTFPGIGELGDMFEHGTADSNEEIDRPLRNGATIDKHNLSRLSETIVSRMETSFDDMESVGAVCLPSVLN